MRTRLLPVAAAILCLAVGIPEISFAGAGPKGHQHSDATEFGEPGSKNRKSRIVTVAMKEGDGKMLFEPNVVRVKRGEQIRFKVSNKGLLDHEIVIATLEMNLAHAKEMEKNPGMEHDDPNMKRLKPGTDGEILWRFTKKGTFDMSCLIPGHRQAGMTGKIIVE
jgi:uncharacterized cupredoxin-like copper-binding protein